MAYIKVRHHEDKQWSFLTPSGGTVRLKIHAARFASEALAQAIVAENKDDNPEFSWKITNT